MAHDVFISYAAEDKPTADAACATLEAKRIRCWIAPRDVLPGMDYAQALVEAIDQSRVMVLVFSARSNHSPHVRREVERAVSRGIPILPFRIEDVSPSPSLEYFIATAHWLDALTPPLEKHLEHLAGTVKLLLARIRKPEQVLADTETLESAPTPEPTIGGGPHKPMPLWSAYEIVKRWASRPIVRFAAVLSAAVAVVLVAVFVLAGWPSGGDNRPLFLVPTSSDASPTLVLPQATVLSTPPPSRTTAGASAPPSTAPNGEVVTKVTVNGFGAPGRTIGGLAWDGTHLWAVSDVDLFKIETSGKVAGAYSVPEGTPEGLAWDGATFWLFTTNFGEIYQFSIDESGGAAEMRIISSFRSPNRTIGPTNDGLAWDGTSLWYSDSHNVYRLDTAGNVLSTFALGQEIAGLAWDGRQLWLAFKSLGENATIAKTDTTGNTLLTFSVPLYEIDALTWGDGHLWAAGTESVAGEHMIYEIDVETAAVGSGQ
jgi:hypothetical protein